jgi:RNA-directed DNA polymerase
MVVLLQLRNPNAGVSVDNYVSQRVRHFLRKRHKVQLRGTTRFSDEAVFGELGALRLRRVQLGPRS